VQLQQLIDTQAGMSRGVAVTADQLGLLAEELRALLPKKEPEPREPEPQAPSPSQSPLQSPHAAVA
jgi:hypothetical protein